MDFNFIGTIWSLLPPVVAIALALKTKEVYSSLDNILSLIISVAASVISYYICKWLDR